MEKYTVLICDDSEAIHRSLKGYLEAERFDVISAYDGETALDILRRQTVHVVLLDIMLPGITGYEVCREIRKKSDVYIIMLSAKDEEIDRVVGLEIGADEYVSKPFSPRVVAIRVKKVINRMHLRQDPAKFALAELTVLPESYQVFVNGKEIPMSSKEVDVLAYMLANEGKVLTREHIINAVWGYDYFGDTRVVDSLIKRLRQKLTKDDVHFVIRSIYGVGYKIEEKQ